VSLDDSRETGSIAIKGGLQELLIDTVVRTLPIRLIVNHAVGCVHLPL
jgi:hypothetical protein